MNTSLVHNTLNDTRKDDLLAVAKTLGNKEGNGMNAKPDLARATLDASIAGVIGTADAADLWIEYASAVRRTQGDEHARLADKADKVRTSELKRFIMVGALPQINPADLFERSIGLIHDSEGVKGSTYENLVKIMRKQCDIADHALNDAEIMEILFPASVDKDEKSRLEAILKSMKRTHDGSKGDADKGVPPQAGFPSEELAEAIVQIETRLATFANKERVKEMLANAAATGIVLADEQVEKMNEILAA